MTRIITLPKLAIILTLVLLINLIVGLNFPSFDFSIVQALELTESSSISSSNKATNSSESSFSSYQSSSSLELSSQSISVASSASSSILTNASQESSSISITNSKSSSVSFSSAGSDSSQSSSLSSIAYSSQSSSSSIAILPCQPNFACFLDTSKLEFNPITSTSIIATQDLTLTVLPGVVNSEAQLNNRFVCRFQLRLDSSDRLDPVGGIAANTSERLKTQADSIIIDENFASESYQIDYDNQSGGCTVTLPKEFQNLPKWSFGVKVMEVDSSNAAQGNVYQTRVSYFLLYGAIPVVTISVSN